MLQEPQSLPLSETDFAHLAGVVDGDGSFLVSRQKAPNGKYYNVEKCCIGMSSEVTIDHILTKYGGAKRKHTTNLSRQKQMWRWESMGDHLRWLIPCLLPYLITKRAQAVVIQEMLELKSIHYTRREASHDVRTAELLEELHRLNKRGVSVVS